MLCYFLRVQAKFLLRPAGTLRLLYVHNHHGNRAFRRRPLVTVWPPCFRASLQMKGKSIANLDWCRRSRQLIGTLLKQSSTATDVHFIEALNPLVYILTFAYLTTRWPHLPLRIMSWLLERNHWIFVQVAVYMPSVGSFRCILFFFSVQLKLSQMYIELWTFTKEIQTPFFTREKSTMDLLNHSCPGCGDWTWERSLSNIWGRRGGRGSCLFCSETQVCVLFFVFVLLLFSSNRVHFWTQNMQNRFYFWWRFLRLCKKIIKKKCAWRFGIESVICFAIYWQPFILWSF